MNTAEIKIQLLETEADFLAEYARSQNLSVSEVIDRFVKRLQGMSEMPIHPEVQKVSGVAPVQDGISNLYAEGLIKKHQ